MAFLKWPRARGSTRPLGPISVALESWQARGLVSWHPLTQWSGTRDLILQTMQPFTAPGGTVSTKGLPTFGLVPNFDNPSDQAIILGQPSPLNITSDLTLCCWYELANTIPDGSSRVLVGATSAEYKMELFSFAAFPSLAGVEMAIGGATDQAPEGRQPVAGDLRMAVGRLDTTAGLIATFVNSVKVNEVSSAGHVPASLTHDVAIGNDGQSTTYFDGRIWDVRIYNRALSDDEIWQLYDPMTRWDLYAVPSARTWFDAGAATYRVVLIRS